jgi:hypothetical protein
MNNANNAVQHLNPACRVARLHPHLPVSRLLMSINDIDFPASVTLEKRDLLSVYFNVLIAVSLLVLTFLPDIIQDVVLETSVTSGLGFIIFVFYFLSNIHFWAAILPAIVVVIIIALYFYFNYRNYEQYKAQNLHGDDDDDIIEEMVANEMLKREKFMDKWKRNVANARLHMKYINRPSSSIIVNDSRFDSDDVAELPSVSFSGLRPSYSSALGINPVPYSLRTQIYFSQFFRLSAKIKTNRQTK